MPRRGALRERELAHVQLRGPGGRATEHALCLWITSVVTSRHPRVTSLGQLADSMALAQTTAQLIPSYKVFYVHGNGREFPLSVPPVGARAARRNLRLLADLWDEYTGSFTATAPFPPPSHPLAHSVPTSATNSITDYSSSSPSSSASSDDNSDIKPQTRRKPKPSSKPSSKPGSKSKSKSRSSAKHTTKSKRANKASGSSLRGSSKQPVKPDKPDKSDESKQRKRSRKGKHRPRRSQRILRLLPLPTLPPLDVEPHAVAAGEPRAVAAAVFGIAMRHYATSLPIPLAPNLAHDAALADAFMVGVAAFISDLISDALPVLADAGIPPPTLPLVDTGRAVADGGALLALIVAAPGSAASLDLAAVATAEPHRRVGMALKTAFDTWSVPALLRSADWLAASAPLVNALYLCMVAELAFGAPPHLHPADVVAFAALRTEVDALRAAASDPTLADGSEPGSEPEPEPGPPERISPVVRTLDDLASQLRSKALSGLGARAPPSVRRLLALESQVTTAKLRMMLAVAEGVAGKAVVRDALAAAAESAALTDDSKPRGGGGKTSTQKAARSRSGGPATPAAPPEISDTAAARFRAASLVSSFAAVEPLALQTVQLSRAAHHLATRVADAETRTARLTGVLATRAHATAPLEQQLSRVLGRHTCFVTAAPSPGTRSPKETAQAAQGRVMARSASGSLTVVALEVIGAAPLLAAFGDVMHEALATLEVHIDRLRRLLHGQLEAASGPYYTLSFSHPGAAVVFALRLHTALTTATWPPPIADVANPFTAPAGPSDARGQLWVAAGIADGSVTLAHTQATGVASIGGETVAAAVALRDAAPGGATFVTEALSLQLATLAHTAARETSSPAQAPSRPPAQSKSGARGKPGRRSDRGSPSLKGGSRSRASLAPKPSKSQVGFTGPEREELAAAELAVDLAAASVPGVGPVFSLAAAKARVHDDARTSAIAASPHLWREAWTLLRARHTPRDSDVNLTETLKAATVAVESDLAAARARLADLRTRIADLETSLGDWLDVTEPDPPVDSDLLSGEPDPSLVRAQLWVGRTRVALSRLRGELDDFQALPPHTLSALQRTPPAVPDPPPPRRAPPVPMRRRKGARVRLSPIKPVD
ncbi:uncharacterized protein AMSG_06969 [Thecamonas trahens ATCC 50062]|uniref:Uncharacterized protein n=1 Tax=Thecamonas trahens ATCC 50062 TaxID=461836 RepID=A0A0L0DFQ4_THETB|nr:hypothetical protein AMSG_06969 [Thecamonas trahens ATCC 50062]KNC50996.1 hypothetical protein AMSG_06969 [Thecamonas trahens ATCC 50062]|eukprot:XP_013756465.1 hypothetical protein AMSG_06969 [Thecamonas trahens ATCC 50062]